MRQPRPQPGIATWGGSKTIKGSEPPFSENGSDPFLSFLFNLGAVETALHWIAETEKAWTPWYTLLRTMFPGSELMADDPRYRVRAAALGLPDPREMGCRP